MRDRLEELRQRMKEASEEDEDGPSSGEGDSVPVVPQAVVFEPEPVLENFLDQVQHIRESINELETEVKKFSQQQKSLVAAMRRFSVMKKESSITRDIKLQAESIHKRLEDLSRRVKSAEAESGPPAAFTRIQRAQHTALFRHFQAVMREYNGSLITKQDKCKQFIIRQLEVSGREVSEEEVDEMVAQGRWEVFNENILHEANITRAQLSEIEQRHKELVSLESNMRELRDLFLEIYMLVEEQGEYIENIQANVQKTQDYVSVSGEKFKMAVKYKKKNPLRKIFCCCCPCKVCK
ncbi:syntaxin-19-like [Scleropages formosus]|uniref:Syntaxin 19 n=1 Tax=Scleropages formosus TaxID=113540 RepID=A0A8C9SAW8_SCLFO|nr:syntaxin-19-like [Scleropages formosus]